MSENGKCVKVASSPFPTGDKAPLTKSLIPNPLVCARNESILLVILTQPIKQLMFVGGGDVEVCSDPICIPIPRQNCPINLRLPLVKNQAKVADLTALDRTRVRLFAGFTGSTSRATSTRFLGSPDFLQRVWKSSSCAKSL